MNRAVTKEEREQALAKMAPIDIACALYTRGGMSEEQFTADLADHLRSAFVVSNPRFFMMFRAVMLDDGRHAWLINSGVGLSLKELAAQLPFKLECVAFHRRGNKELRIYDFDTIIRKATRR